MKYGLALCAAVLLAGAADGRQLYVFGDSLVDAGNVSLITGGTNPDPARGFFDGRFTNGYNFTDYLQIRLTGAPTFASLGGGNSYAWGGARATSSGGFPVPGLAEQIAAYQSDSGGMADRQGLYVLNFGGNDVFGLQSGNLGGLDPVTFVDRFLDRMTGAITTLDTMGARRILVMGVPNRGPVGEGLEGLLQARLDILQPMVSTQLIRFSYLDFVGRLLADPAAYGFPGGIDVARRCFDVRPVVGGRVDCAGFFSFDGTHFTTEVHRALARDVAIAANIPEPASWAMLIVGFGVVGACARQRRRTEHARSAV